MTTAEIIRELNNMRKFNYTLAPEEVFDKAISALRDREKIKRARDEISDFNIRKFYADFPEPFQLGVCTGMDKSVEIIDKYCEVKPND